MARINDIVDRGTDKDYKDVGERAWSAARLLWLPSVLGIVAAQDKFIIGGIWKDLYIRIEEQLTAIVKAAVTDPNVTSMSGGKPISYFIQDIGSKLNNDLTKKKKGFIESNLEIAKQMMGIGGSSPEVDILSRSRIIDLANENTVSRARREIAKVGSTASFNVEAIGLDQSALRYAKIAGNYTLELEERMKALSRILTLGHAGRMDPNKAKLLKQAREIGGLEIIKKAIIRTEAEFKHSLLDSTRTLVPYERPLFTAVPSGKELAARYINIASAFDDPREMSIALDFLDGDNKSKALWARKFLQNHRKLQKSYGVFSSKPEVQDELIRKMLFSPVVAVSVHQNLKSQITLRDYGSILSEDVFRGSLSTETGTLHTLDIKSDPKLQGLTNWMDTNLYHYTGTDKNIMVQMESLHRNIFVAAGQEPLYDQAYNTKNLKARLIADVREGLVKWQTELQGWKDGILSLQTKASRGDTQAKSELIRLARQYRSTLSTSSKIDDKALKEFIKWVREVKTSVYVNTHRAGALPFQTLMIETDLGVKGKIKIPIHLESQGRFLTDFSTNLRSTFLRLGLNQTSSVENVQTATLDIAKHFNQNNSHYWRDFVENNFDPEKVNRSWRKHFLTVQESTSIAGGTSQDFIRSTKLISDSMRVLSGEQKGYFSSSWYRGIAGGLRSLETLTKDFAAEVFLDLEFSYPGSRFGGSQQMAKHSGTRPYMLAYRLKKDGAMSLHESLILHQEATWNEMRGNIKDFMSRHGEGSLSFEELERVIKRARGEFQNTKGNVIKTADIVGTKGLPNRLLGILPTHIYRNEGSAVLAFAQNIYKNVGQGSNILFAGHNINEADIPILHRAADREIREMKNVQRKPPAALLRLFEDTSSEALLSKHNFMDTYTMGRLATSHSPTPLGLTDLFNTLISEQASSHSRFITEKMTTQEFFKHLGTAIKSNSSSGITRLLEGLPKSLKANILTWLESDKAGLLKVISEGTHHSAGFDVGAAALLSDLLSDQITDMKFYKPLQYENMIKIGNVAREIEKGRYQSWHAPIDNLSHIDLYSNDPGNVGNTWLYSSVFSFSPTQAAAGIGAAYGIEKYLPFAMFSNLQKQRYQVSAARSLAPGAYRKAIEVAGGFYPVTTGRIWDTMNRSQVDAFTNEDSTYKLGLSSRNKIGLKYDKKLRRHIPVYPTERLPLPNKVPVMAWHLSTGNRIFGEDTAVAMHRQSLEMLRSLPKGGGYKISIDWPAIGYHINETTIAKTPITKILELSGLSKGLVKAVELKYGKQTIAQIIGGAADRADSIALLDLVDEAQKEKFFDDINAARRDPVLKRLIYDPSKQNTLLDTKVANQETLRLMNKEPKELSSYMDKQLKNKIRQTAIIDSIRIDVGDIQAAKIIFNFIPVSTSTGIKAITQVGANKTYIYGVEGPAYRADASGASFLMTDKTQSVDMYIDKHMRRALTQIHDNSNSLSDQKRKIIKMLSDGFDLTTNEVNLTFDIVPEKIVYPDLQPKYSEKFGGYMYSVKVKDYTKIPLNNLNMFKSIHRVLEAAGVTHENMKKRFIKLNENRLSELVSKRKMKSQLGKLFEDTMKETDKNLNRLLASGELKTADEIAIVHEVRQAVQQKKVMLGDLFLHIDETTLGPHMEQIKKHGILDEQGELHRALKLDPFAALYIDEMSVIETTGDFRWTSGLLRDSYGTPIKKSFSHWQMLLLQRQLAGMGKDSLMNNIISATLMSTSGHYDPNIRQGLRAHKKVIEALAHGYEFGKVPAGINVMDMVTMKKLHAAYNESKELRHIPIHQMGSREQNIIRQGLGIKEDEFTELMKSKTVTRLSRERVEKEFAALYGPDASLHPQDAMELERQKGRDHMWKIDPTKDSRGMYNIQKELMYLELPKVNPNLSAKIIVEMDNLKMKSDEFIKVFNFIGDDFSEEFFKQIEQAAIESIDNSSQRGKFKARLSNKTDKALRGKIHGYLPIANLWQEGPVLAGAHDQVFLYGASKYKMELVNTIAERNKFLEKQSTEINKLLKGKDIKGVQEIINLVRESQTEYAKELAGQWERLSLFGISVFELKAQRFFAEPGAPYQKIAPLNVLKGTIGRLVGHVSKGNQYPGVKKAIKEFVKKYEGGKANQVGETTKRVLQDQLTDLIGALDQKPSKVLSLADPLSGLTLSSKLYNTDHSFIKKLDQEIALHDSAASAKQGVSRASVDEIRKRHKWLTTLKKGMLKMTFGENLAGVMHDIPDALNTWDLKKRPAYLAAKGAGLGETIITAPNFEQWLGESIKKTPDKLMKVKAEDIIKLLKGGDAPEIIIDLLKREPQFANYEYGNFSQPFVYSRELLLMGGIDTNTQKSTVFINNLELLLQRGDYDGDLIQRYIMNLQANDWKETGKLGRREAVEALQRSRLASAKTMLLAASMNENPAKIGLSDHLRSFHDNLYLLPERYNAEKDMEKVLDQMIKESKGGRILFHKDIITESASDKTFKEYLNIARMEGPQSSLNTMEIYMVQKNLTPFIGAQARNVHMWLMELDRSSTEVGINLFGDELKRIYPSRHTLDSKNEIKLWLDQLGIDPDAFRKDYKYRGKTDWDILSEWHKGKQDSIDFLQSTVADNTKWASSSKAKEILGAGAKLTHLDLFNLTFGSISQVPITKAKEFDFQQYKRDFRRLMKWMGGIDIQSSESEYWTLQLVKGLESEEGRAINIARAGDAQAVKARYKGVVKSYQHVANLLDYRTRTSNLVTDMGSVLAGKQSMDRAGQMMRTYMGQPTIQGDMMRMIGDQNLIGISTPEQLFDLWWSHDPTTQVSRAAKEEMGFTIRKTTDWMMKHKWGRRASLGLLAMVMLDPNTNSLLLPDQRGGGEVYDWPSLNELTKSYRNRGINRAQAKLRTKQLLPSTVDKILQEVQLPKSFGNKNIISEFIPRPPNTITYNRNEAYRNNPLTIQEYTRRVNGMLLN